MVNFKEDARKNLLYFVRRKFSEWMFEFGVFVFILVLPAVIPSGGVQLTSSLSRIKHWDQNRTDALPELLNKSLITLLMTLSKCWRCFLWRKVSLTPQTVSLETWEWESDGLKRCVTASAYLVQDWILADKDEEDEASSQ